MINIIIVIPHLLLGGINLAPKELVRDMKFLFLDKLFLS